MGKDTNFQYEELYKHGLSLGKEITMMSYNATFNYGTQAMKTLFILSGGTGVALLAFIGHLTSVGKGEIARQLAFSLLCFFLASFLASLGFAFSYLAQNWYSGKLEQYYQEWQKNYLSNGDEGKEFRKGEENNNVGDKHQERKISRLWMITVSSTGLGYFACILGGIKAYCVFSGI